MSDTRDVYPELLRAVLDAPLDDAPRMVLADWYMQRGEPRGELIAAQCRLAGRGLSPSTRAFLGRQARHLLAEHGDQWAAPARAIAHTWEFRRGFIHRITSPADAVLAGWQALWEVEPVIALELEDAGAEAMARLASLPLLARVRHLTVRGIIGDQGLAALASSPHALGLERLNLKGTGVSDAGVRRLTAAEGLRLRSLALTGNAVTDQGAELLARSPVLASLEALYLSRTRVGDRGVTALAQTPHGSALTTLALGTLEELTDTGAQALLDTSALPSLRRLEVDCCDALSYKMRAALRKRWPRLRG